MVLPCNPIIEPIRVVHRAVRHYVRHTAGVGTPVRPAVSHAPAVQHMPVTTQTAVPPANCVSAPGDLPAGPAEAARAAAVRNASAGAQPVFGAAMPSAVAASSASSLGGFGTASTTGLGGALAGLTSQSKAAIIAATLAAGSAVGTLPLVPTALDYFSSPAPVILAVSGPNGSGDIDGPGVPVPLTQTSTPGADTVPTPAPTPVPASVPVPVPEPASAAIFAVALFGAVFKRQLFRK